MSDTAQRPVASILFLCTMNSVRSPIAEGVARQKLGRSVYVESAGLIRSERNAFAVAVLQEIGVDISEDEPRTVEGLALEGFDMIVTLSSEARDVVAERIRASAITHLHWAIDDPTLVTGPREARLAAFRAVRDQIRTRVKEEIIGHTGQRPEI